MTTQPKHLLEDLKNDHVLEEKQSSIHTESSSNDREVKVLLEEIYELKNKLARQEELIKLNNDDNAALIEDDYSFLDIVNDVETRLIQEKIETQWKKHDEIKIRLKDFIIPVVVLLTSIVSFSVFVHASTENSNLAFLLLMTGAIGLVGTIVGGTASAFSPSERRLFVKEEINTQRIDLAEKMLNVEILKKENVKITEEWDEVMALDKNGDYVKILIRIVKDQETGLETIESKMLKNQ